MKKLIILLLTSIALQGCASKYEKVVGIGSDRDELKKSPCACLEIYNYKG